MVPAETRGAVAIAALVAAGPAVGTTRDDVVADARARGHRGHGRHAVLPAAVELGLADLEQDFIDDLHDRAAADVRVDNVGFEFRDAFAVNVGFRNL